MISHSVVGTPAAPTSVGYSYTDRHSPIPYSEQASLEINREIGRGFTVGAGYLFVAAHHLLRSTLGNLCPVEGISSGPYPCPSGRTAAAGLSGGQELLQRHSALSGRPDLLQRSDRKFRLSRRHAAAEQDGREIFQPQCQLHAVAHSGRRHVCDVHQRSGGRFPQGSGTRHLEPGCAPSFRYELLAGRSFEFVPAEFPAEQHRHSSKSAAVYAVRGLRCEQRPDSRRPIALGIFRAIRTRATACRRGTSVSRARSNLPREGTRLELARRCIQSCSTARTWTRSSASTAPTISAAASSPGSTRTRQAGHPGRAGRRLSGRRAAGSESRFSVLRERCSIRGSCNCR